MMPIIALHGFTGSAASWASFDGFTALPLLGHDPSVPAVPGDSFDREVDRLIGVIETIGTPVHLVGYSMGGRLALAITARRPTLVPRLTVIGVNPGLSGHQRAARAVTDHRWTALLRTGGIRAFVDAWQALPIWSSQRALPASRLVHQRSVRLTHNPEQLALALEALGVGTMPPLWNMLDSLRAQVTYVAGTLDSKYVDLSLRAAMRTASCRVRLIGDAGHNPVIERPQAIHSLCTESQPLPQIQPVGERYERNQLD